MYPNVSQYFRETAGGLALQSDFPNVSEYFKQARDNPISQDFPAASEYFKQARGEGLDLAPALPPAAPAQGDPDSENFSAALNQLRQLTDSGRTVGEGLTDAAGGSGAAAAPMPRAPTPPPAPPPPARPQQQSGGDSNTLRVTLDAVASQRHLLQIYNGRVMALKVKYPIQSLPFPCARKQRHSL